MNTPKSIHAFSVRGASLFTTALFALAAAAPGAAQEAPQADDGEAQNVVVTGTRLGNTGFTAPTPVTVMDADRIARTSSPTVGEALAQLPSFRPSSTPNTQNIFPANAGARISDLRGLGASRTLVLLDGRRFTPSTSTGTIDLNMIPTLLVRSAEIVTGGASAAYGSDAVSGVINLRLDTRLDGLKATAGYGVTDRGDGEQYFWQFGAGKRFADDRGRIIIGAEYNKDRGTGGCYTREFCGNEVGDLTNPPGLNGRPAHNIITGMRTATLTPGGLITATINGAGVSTPARGSVLGGIQFGANGLPTQFVYGQNASGLFQQGGTGEGLNAFFDDPLLSIPVVRYNTFAHMEYEFSPAFTAFLEGSYGHVEGFTRGPEIREAATVRIDNPFLPGTIRQTMQDNGIAALTVGKLGVDLGRMNSTSVRDTYRIVGGAQGDLGGGWAWDAHVQYGETAYNQHTVNNRINARYSRAIDAVDGPNGPICRVNADGNPANDDPACVALNILGQGQYSQAAKAYAFGTSWQDNKFTQLAGALNINGTPFETWAGPVAVAAGVEGRRNTLNINVDPVSAGNGFYVFNQTPSAGNTSVVEGYLELGVPLLQGSSFGSLDLNGAIRQAHYKNEGAVGSNSFQSTTWKVGATYRPVNWAMLRGTYSRDFRAPNTSELFTTPVGGIGVFYDTFKGAEKFMNLLTGGNVNLRPETASTFTTGLTLQPQGALQGLRFSVDYYNIRISDAIATLPAQVILNTCNSTNAADFCSLIQRDSAGFVDTISVLFLNLNRQQLRGIDIEAGYNLPLGSDKSLDLRVLATHTIDFTNSAQPGIDRAGDNSAVGIPAWVMDGFATVEFGRLGVNLQGRYIGKGKFDATLVGPEDQGYSVTLPNSINTNRVPSRFYTNIGVTYDLISRGSQKLELFANVYNLFDVMPPPYWNGNNNAVYYDNVGRRYRMGARVIF